MTRPRPVEEPHGTRERIRAAIDRIVSGAESRHRLSAVGAPPRPQKKEIIEVLRLLQEVIYPGYFGETTLYRDNLRDHLGDVLYRTHLKLCGELEKAFGADEHPSARARSVTAAASGSER